MNISNYDSIEHHKISSFPMQLAYEQHLLEVSRLKKLIVAVVTPIFHLIEATYHAYHFIGGAIFSTWAVISLTPILIPLVPLKLIDKFVGSNFFNAYLDEPFVTGYFMGVMVVVTAVASIFRFNDDFYFFLRAVKVAVAVRNIFYSVRYLFNISAAIDHCYGPTTAAEIKARATKIVQSRLEAKKVENEAQRLVKTYNEIKNKIDTINLDKDFDNNIKELNKDIKIYEAEWKNFWELTKKERRDYQAYSLFPRNLNLMNLSKKYVFDLSKQIEYQKSLSEKYVQFNRLLLNENQLKSKSQDDRKIACELISAIEGLSCRYTRLNYEQAEKSIYRTYYKEIEDQEKKLSQLESENRENEKKILNQPIAKELSAETLLIEIRDLGNKISSAQDQYTKLSKTISDAVNSAAELSEEHYLQHKKEIQELGKVHADLQDKAVTLFNRTAKRVSPENSVKEHIQQLSQLSPQKLLETMNAKMYEQTNLKIALAEAEVEKAYTNATESVKKIKSSLSAEQRIKETKGFEPAIDDLVAKCREQISEAKKYTNRKNFKEILEERDKVLGKYTFSPEILVKFDNFKDLAIDLPSLTSLKLSDKHLSLNITKTTIPPAPAGINLEEKFAKLFTEIEQDFPNQIVLGREFNDPNGRIQYASKSELINNFKTRMKLLSQGILRDVNGKETAKEMAEEARNCMTHLALTFEERVKEVEKERNVTTQNKLKKMLKTDLSTMFSEIGAGTFYCMDRFSQSFLRNYIKFVERKKFDDETMKTPFKDRILDRLLQFRRMAFTEALGDNIHDAAYFENLFNDKLKLNLPKNLNTFRAYDNYARATEREIEARFWKNYNLKAINDFLISTMMNPNTKDIPYGYCLHEMSKRHLFTSKQVHDANEKISPETIGRVLLDFDIVEKASLLGRVQNLAVANVLPDNNTLRGIRDLAFILFAGLYMEYEMSKLRADKPELAVIPKGLLIGSMFFLGFVVPKIANKINQFIDGNVHNQEVDPDMPDLVEDEEILMEVD